MTSKSRIVFPAEWHPQSAIQLTWPHFGMDWPNLNEVTVCFVQIAIEISKRQKLLIVCKNKSQVQSELVNCNQENVLIQELDTNDSWARDHGGITILEHESPVVLDFGFNGWGCKYHFDKDNKITKSLFDLGVFQNDIKYHNQLDFVLEGGSIESDGNGTLMTTSSCLLSKHRNDHLTKQEIEEKLKGSLGLQKILWLNHGHLAGDDTDGHIDTLARFCSEDTIAYVKCDDTDDQHFEELKQMEYELKSFRTAKGLPYKLVPLPMAEPLYSEENRLPATYANFLILNKAILIPFYGSPMDERAKETLQSIFIDRKVVGINCRSLIEQNGSLHCVTMQFPKGVV